MLQRFGNRLSIPTAIAIARPTAMIIAYAPAIRKSLFFFLLLPSPSLSFLALDATPLLPHPLSSFLLHLPCARLGTRSLFFRSGLSRASVTERSKELDMRNRPHTWFVGLYVCVWQCEGRPRCRPSEGNPSPRKGSLPASQLRWRRQKQQLWQLERPAGRRAQPWRCCRRVPPT